MKRSTIPAVAGACALLLTAACGSNGGGSGNADSSTITWLDGWTDGDANDAIEKLIAEYEDEHEGVTIERTTVPFGDIRTTLIQNVSAGDAPDVVAFDSPDTQTLAAQDILSPLGEYMDGWAPRDEYYEGAWDSAQYEGETYGVPLYSDAAGIYANMDLLEAAGIKAIPTTWSEMTDAAKAVDSKGVNGICFGTTPYESASYLILPFIWQTGGDLDELETAAVPGLQYFAELMEDELAPPDVVAWSWEDAMNQFLNGKCGIVFGGPWNSKDVGDTDFRAESGPVPYQDSGQPASVLGGFNIGSAAGSNTDAAWDVIEWMTSTEHLGEFLTDKQQLPNRSDLEDLPFIEEDPLLPPFVEAISVAKPRDYGENWPEMSQALQTMIQQVVAQKSTPEDAAKTAAEVINPLMPE